MEIKKRPWSISTTVRNPERLRDFLIILNKLEGKKWNTNTQEAFQISLIQHKLYGIGNLQFYKNLTEEEVSIIDNPEPCTFEEARNILLKKNYVGGGDMRGRQSFNPLKKMGFAFVDTDSNLRISELGKLFLEKEYDLSEIFFRSFIKWQLPNPSATEYKYENGYDIKPFVATLHLINEVNKLCKVNGDKEKGISMVEFKLFTLTLINYKNIAESAKKIIKFRKILKKLNEAKKNIFTDKYENLLKNFYTGINNLSDYADNAIRYFRLTKYIYVRGNGFYIDNEPRRQFEIQSLLKSDNASSIVFDTDNEYTEYLTNPSTPIMEWEANLAIIGREIIEDIKILINSTDTYKINVEKLRQVNLKSVKAFTREDIRRLRALRRKLQEIIEYNKSQELDYIINLCNSLKDIFQSKNKRSIELEKIITLLLNSLNDAITIQPNYPVGDDNKPTFTAPGNKPDIECFYNSFNSICEVTLLSDRNQWFAEGQPVMRHLRDFENKYTKKDNYCLFIAPKIHRDTLNTYWNSIRYEYEGKKQKIIPITIEQFLVIIDTLKECKAKHKQFKHRDIKLLFDNIINSVEQFSTSEKWCANIYNELNNWKNYVINNAN